MSDPSDEIGKRYPLSLRTTKELRDTLNAAASAAGRSVAQEVEYRLQRDMDRERQEDISLGGPHVAGLMRTLGNVIALLEQRLGIKWHEAEWEEDGQFRDAIDKVLGASFFHDSNTLKTSLGPDLRGREAALSALRFLELSDAEIDKLVRAKRKRAAKGDEA